MRQPVTNFLGLNNVADPLLLGLSWQQRADNVDITTQGRIMRRTGFTEAVAQTANAGAYATKDELRAYVVDAGTLKQVNADLSLTTLATGLSSKRMYFAEENGQVFCTNGVDYRIIFPNGRVKRWGVPTAPAPRVSIATGTLSGGRYRVVATLVDLDGLEGGNSDVVSLDIESGQQIQITPAQVAGYTTNVYVTTVDGSVFFLLGENVTGSVSYSVRQERLGRELRYWMTNGPLGVMPCFFRGQVYTAEFFPDEDASALWFSLPLQHHHFDISSNGHAIPGRILVLKAVPGALIIGTDRAIHAFDGAALTTIVDYGVVQGHHDAMLGGRLYVWTQRGLCRMLPFENLTERTVSVAPGTFAGATVIEQGGNVRYIVALQAGGNAYNQFS